ncbi:hypothetical protein F5Y18DRAFT_373861 [Xylariaceae sp. FL1019]|nr:hypothetical protein F5Y18DRAFT_373861 [Xylariaceae sp. FL1019]
MSDTDTDTKKANHIANLELKGRLTKNGMTYDSQVVTRYAGSDRVILDSMKEAGIVTSRQNVRAAVIEMFQQAEPLIRQHRPQGVELFRILWMLKKRCEWATTMNHWLFADFFVALVEARRRWELSPRVRDLRHSMPMTRAIVSFRHAVGDGIQTHDPTRTYTPGEIPSWIAVRYAIEYRRMHKPMVCPVGFRPNRHPGVSRAYQIEGDKNTYHQMAPMSLSLRRNSLWNLCTYHSLTQTVVKVVKLFLFLWSEFFVAP